MADVQHAMGGDLALGANGDLVTVDDQDLTLQSLTHRLLTASGSYIWHLEYGTGLPAMVGTTVSAQQIAAIIRAQLSREATVAAVPIPEISVTALTDGVTIATISYVDASSGNTVSQQIALES